MAPAGSALRRGHAGGIAVPVGCGHCPGDPTETTATPAITHAGLAADPTTSPHLMSVANGTGAGNAVIADWPLSRRLAQMALVEVSFGEPGVPT
jgi:hypothetical protein